MGQWKDLLLQRGKLLEVQRQEICSRSRNAGFSEECRRVVVWMSKGAKSPAGEFDFCRKNPKCPKLNEY